jgi:predicted P-loop ATPase
MPDLKRPQKRKRKQLLPRTGQRIISSSDEITDLLLFNERSKWLPDEELTAAQNHARVQPATIQNVQYIMERAGVSVRLNMMSKREEFSFAGEIYIEPDLARKTIVDLLERSRIRNRANIDEALLNIAKINRYHPAEDWVLLRPWDGRDHFNVLVDSIPCQHIELTRVYLRRWMIQVIECIRGWRSPEPAIKDLVLVLVGGQGLYKTSWAQYLMPSDFVLTGASLALDGYAARDSIHQATSHAIVELGELETTFGASQQGALKNFFSRSVDLYRRAYARTEVEWPRGTSYIATINIDQFLRDVTGARRFIPVKITGHMPRPTHIVDIQQMWAQINVLWEAGERWVLDGDEEQLRRDHEEDFTESNEVEDLLEAYFSPNFKAFPEDCWLPVTYTQIAELCRFKPSREHTHRVSAWLAAQGHQRRSQLSVNGIVKRRCWLLPVTGTDAQRFLNVETATYEKIKGLTNV